MIKLSNKEASALLSPIANVLFNDPNRKFPITVSFTILDIIQEAEKRIKLFRDKVKEIIEQNNGEIEENGEYKFKVVEDRKKAEDEISSLSSLEFEYSGDFLEITEDWPKLSIQEAYILKPLIKRK